MSLIKMQKQGCSEEPNTESAMPDLHNLTPDLTCRICGRDVVMVKGVALCFGVCGTRFTEEDRAALMDAGMVVETKKKRQMLKEFSEGIEAMRKAEKEQ